MEKILIVSHGNLAQELCKACEMITGQQDLLDAVCLNDCGLEEFEVGIQSYLEVNQKQTLYILCDFLHGTPYNQVLIKMLDYTAVDYHMITGVNLPVLLTLYMSLLNRNDDDAHTVCKKAIEAGQTGITLREAERTYI